MIQSKIMGSYSRGISFISKRLSSTKSVPTQNQISKNTRNAIIATVTSIGLSAFYYDMYISPGRAMTEAEEGLHAPKWPWYHNGFLNTYDHASLRRGFQVYQEVCAACHSLNRIAWRNLVGVTHTVDEAREFAANFEYDSEPNDEGLIEKRPGKLADYLPSPYPNEQAARASNNGALPPDLSLITKARHGGADYVFSLLTGYPDEMPAGATIGAGLNYNPYFPGGGIAMARVLFDGLVEFDDGTPATTSQLAKDVVTFLNWAAEPELDERKRQGLKFLIICSSLFAVSVWIKRFKWANVKTRKFVYNPPKAPRL